MLHKHTLKVNGKTLFKKVFDLDIKGKVKAKNYILSLCKLDFSSFHMLILYTKINIEILHNLKKTTTSPCF
jgi:hypothetical protein